MSTMQVAKRTYSEVSQKSRPLDAFSRPPPEFPLLCVAKRRSNEPGAQARLDADEREWRMQLARTKAALAAEEAEWRTLRALAALLAREESEWREQISRASARGLTRPAHQPPPLPVRRAVA